MTGLLCLQQHKYCTNPTLDFTLDFTLEITVFFFAFAFVCPLPAHILCVLPHFNKHKYLGKKKKIKFKMKELVGSWKLQIFICTIWIPLGFDGKTGTFLCWSSSRVPVSLSPVCSPWSTMCFTRCFTITTSRRKKLFPKHDSAKLCLILRREHPSYLKSIALHTTSDRKKKNIVILVYWDTH